MPDWTLPIVRHLVSGDAFFSGGLLVLLGLFIRSRSSARGNALGGSLIIFGSVLAAASAMPLPLWLTAVLFMVTAIAVFKSKATRQYRLAIAGIWLLALYWAATFLRHPSLHPAANPELIVLGDSISAGVDDGTPNWPRLILERGVRVTDYSRAGATLASLRKTLPESLPAGCVVMVELGGNDILSGGNLADFTRDLDALLQQIQGDGRQVVLLELPWPPLWNRYGIAQRSLAQKYGAQLIPRRVMAGLLFRQGATVDFLHPSAAGHQAIASKLAEIVRPALPERSTSGK